MKGREVIHQARYDRMLNLLMAGKTYGEIGEELQLSRQIVQRSFARIYQKHGVRNRYQMILKMHGRGRDGRI